MRIAVVGAGYVGLTAAVCFARQGHDVSCHDVDARLIERLARRELPIYEPGLDLNTGTGAGEGTLDFTHSASDCVTGADIVFLAVGTPSGPRGQIDLSHVISAARAVAKALRPGAVIAIKSTVVAGTCRRIRHIVGEERRRLDFSVASNPEFLREGSAVKDFMEPDRVVIGTDDRRSRALLEELYRPQKRCGVKMICTSTINAELIKYAANAFLALKVGFINEVADLCEKTGGDILAVATGIGLDHRVGIPFLQPGPGFGGSCFPKDTRALVATGRKHGAPQILVETLIGRNEERKAALARRIISQASLKRGDVVAVLGLAFKANTDDVRESAALTIIPRLQKAGLKVRVHDPKAMDNASRHLERVQWAETPYDAARDASAVIILTEWDDYKRVKMERLAALMAGRYVFDYRNLLEPRKVTEQGLTYIGLGRPSVSGVRPAGSGALSLLDQRVAAPRTE